MMGKTNQNFLRSAGRALAAALMLVAIASPLRAQTSAATSAAPAAADAQGAINLIPEGFENAIITPHPNAQLPLDAMLKDENGNTVKLGDYFKPGRPVLLNFVYFECPMLCNLNLNGMLDVVKPMSLKIGDDYEIVTISFNHKETPKLATAKKKNYMNALGIAGAEKGWHFLTGEESQILKLTSAAGFGFKWSSASQEYLHQTGVFVCTPQGRISRTIGGVTFERPVLKDSLIAASSGKIGSPIFQVFLSCGVYHYDDSSGRYVRSKWLPLFGGVAIMLAVGGMLGTLWYRDSRRHHEVDNNGASNNGASQD